MAFTSIADLLSQADSLKIMGYPGDEASGPQYYDDPRVAWAKQLNHEAAPDWQKWLNDQLLVYGGARDPSGNLFTSSDEQFPLYGNLGKGGIESINSALIQIANASGVNNEQTVFGPQGGVTGFWKPYIAAAAKQNFDATGSTYRMGQQDYREILKNIVELAAKDYPQLAQGYEQVYPRVEQQLINAMPGDQQHAARRERRHDYARLAAVALPLAAFGGAALFGGAGGTAAGLGASELAAADIALGGAGGSAGAASLGAGGATAAGTGAVGFADSLYGAATGYGSLPQAELAAMIESGTAGAAGASLEGLAGIGAGGGVSGLSAGLGLGTFGGGGGGNQPLGKYSFPLGSVIGSILEGYGANRGKQSLEDIINQAIASDQWRGQQSRYFEPLYETVTKGVGGTAYGNAIADSTARSMASRGYNVSGNQMTEIAKSLDAGTNQRIGALAPLAMGRGESNIFGQLGGQVANSQRDVYGAVGYGLDQIFRGQQPTQAQQTSGGQRPNQNFWDYIQKLV